MNKTLIFAALTLAACTAGKDDSGDTAVAADTSDTGTPAAMTWAASKTAEGLTLTISNGAGTYQLGIIGGEYNGEDCIEGAGTMGYDKCHSDILTGTTAWEKVNLANDTEEALYAADDGSKYTVYSSAVTEDLAYALWSDETGDCWTTGDAAGVIAFEAAGCEAM
jgi:hypothetical protein